MARPPAAPPGRVWEPAAVSRVHASDSDGQGSRLRVLGFRVLGL